MKDNNLAVKKILQKLKKKGSKKRKARMIKGGIEASAAFGVSVPEIRKLAKEIGKNHRLAQELWKTKIHEARLLACLVDEVEKVTEKQMDRWANDFYSWDLCDHCCSNLFDKTKIAYRKAKDWAKSEKEFVRRAGFAMIACLSVHDKKAEDNEFEQFFPLIKKYSFDERNFVKKAVNWALRQIGKRNKKLCEKALKVARKIKKIDSKSARWIASDAIRELEKKKSQGYFDKNAL